MALRDNLPGRPSGRQVTPRANSGRPPLPPFVRYEDVTVACGHTEKFGLCEDRKDKYRDARRKKVMERACKACREQRQREEQEALERRRTEKEKIQPVQGQKSRVKVTLGRLPHGSRFELGYDSATETWSGTLTVPVPETAPAVFTASSSGVFKLLNVLDRLYRAGLPPVDETADDTGP